MQKALLATWVGAVKPTKFTDQSSANDHACWGYITGSEKNPLIKHIIVRWMPHYAIWPHLINVLDNGTILYLGNIIPRRLRTYMPFLWDIRWVWFLASVIFYWQRDNYPFPRYWFDMLTGDNVGCHNDTSFDNDVGIMANTGLYLTNHNCIKHRGRGGGGV